MWRRYNHLEMLNTMVLICDNKEIPLSKIGRELKTNKWKVADTPFWQLFTIENLYPSYRPLGFCTEKKAEYMGYFPFVLQNQYGERVFIYAPYAYWAESVKNEKL